MPSGLGNGKVPLIVDKPRFSLNYLVRLKLSNFSYQAGISLVQPSGGFPVIIFSDVIIT